MNLEQELLFEKTRAQFWEERATNVLEMVNLTIQIAVLRPINLAAETTLH